MLRKFFTSLVSSLSLVALAGFALARTPSSLPSDEAIREMLITRVDGQKRATGIVIGVVEPGGRRIVAYGTMAAGEKRAVDGNTVFDIGSVTKVFTALLLADMVQRGKMALGDPAAQYLPAEDVTLPERAGRKITLTDLATHTSGLPLRATNLPSKDELNPYAGYSVDLLYRFVSSFTLTRDIGSQYEYSNVGYGLLADVISRRAKLSYRECLRTRITEPLGMHDTAVELTPAMKGRLAAGYSIELAPVRNWEWGPALEGAGALHSTTNDLLRFMEALLGYTNSSLSLAMKAMSETRRPGGIEPSTHIALAWNVLVNHEHEIIWKNGSVGGYRTFLGYDPKARIGVVALANAQTPVGADDIGLHLLQPAMQVDLTIPKSHTEIILAPEFLDRYVGRYRFSPTDILTVTREGDHIFGEEPGQGKTEMFAESQHDFFLKVVDAQLTFESIGDGPARAVIWHQDGHDLRGERVE